MARWRIYILFLLTVQSLYAYAQPKASEYKLFTTRDGLPNNNVLAIYPDSYGFLWVSTYNSICSFDGYNFKKINNIFNTEEQNWEHAVQAIYEDVDSNIWLGSHGGLISCYIRKENKFKHYENNSIRHKIKAFCQQDDNTIWVCFENGDIGTIQHDSLSIIASLKTPLHNISNKDANILYIFSQEKIYEYNTKNNSIDSISIPKGEQIINVFKKKNRAVVILNTKLIVLDSAGISYQEKNTVTTTSYGYNDMIVLRDSNYYYTDGNVICELNGKLNKTDSIIIGDNISYNKNEILRDFKVGATGILWMATGSGLYMIDIRKPYFSKYTINQNIGHITHNYIRSIFADSKERVWVGYRSGSVNILKKNSQTRTYELYKKYKQRDYRTTNYHTYTTNSFAELKNGTILAGGQQGVFQNTSKGSLKPFFSKKYHEEINEVWNIIEDENKNIWIGTNNFGLFVYDSHKRSLHHYQYNDSDSSLLINNSVWKIFEDSQGEIWIGTDNGLLKVDNKNDIANLSFRVIIKPKNRKIPIWSITEDVNKKIWIGTIGSGLYCFNISAQTLERINKFETNNISGIVVDEQNALWITTTDGLYKFDQVNNIINKYTEADGLTSNEFNFDAISANSDGTIFAGTKTGMSVFDPKSLSTDTEATPKILITSINVGKDDSSQALYNSNSIELNRHQHNFTIEFIPTDLSLAKHTYFRYQLVNYNNNWVNLQPNNNRAIFTNIPPGNYEFNVQCSKDGRHWYTNTTRLNINIQFAIWELPLFKLLLLLFSIIIIGILIRIRFKFVMNKERDKTTIEKKIAQLELKALRAQMKPHFVFNTLNSIQHYIVHNDVVSANAYLSKFARLMRSFLDSSNNRYILLSQELEQLELYISLEQLRFEDKFKYKINLDEDIPTGSLKIPSMLVQPFIENAIIHGISNSNKKGQLNITLTKNRHKNCLTCIIEDNGIGRESARIINKSKNKYHKSYGTQMIADRIKTYNSIEKDNIKIATTDKVEPESGTLVEITLPLIYITDKNQHYD